MQRRRARLVATCGAFVLLVGLGTLGFACAFASSAGAGEAPAPIDPPLARSPLARPIVTGGFAETRSNHFHGGLDFSTGGHVGEPVFAPLAGSLERVRGSGVGYGRSLYLRADDGRLLVFGHLDAYAPNVAAWVDSIQRASGQYEQDLAPPRGRFRFAAGDRIAWTGSSGSGGPHLHMEIRHDDFALHPLRAGYPLDGVGAPRVEALALEPLDEGSFVERGAAPRSWTLREAPETLLVEGRVRAVVRARTGLARAADDTPAWSTAIAWEGRTFEVRLDSISWAGEMSQQDELLDRGRVTNSRGWILWHPPGFVPRFVRTAPGDWSGTIEIAPGEPPRPLAITAREPNGLETTRTVWLRGPRADERGPDTTRVARASRESIAWSFASLPGERLRVRVSGVPAGVAAVRIGFARGIGADAIATADDDGWSAVLAPSIGASTVRASGRTPEGAPWSAASDVALWPAGTDSELACAPFARLVLDASAVFERGWIVTRVADVRRGGRGDLVPLSPALVVEPARTALRRACRVAFDVDSSLDRAGVDLYRLDSDGWTPLRATWDEARAVLRGESTLLGTFAVMRDSLAPTASLQRPMRRAPRTPYPRWQLVATAADGGSGIDPRASFFEIDGARVPTEWDPEDGQLRWRPRQTPKPGAHRVSIVVADRAGNAVRRSGRFVLDSARR